PSAGGASASLPLLCRVGRVFEAHHLKARWASKTRPTLHNSGNGLLAALPGSRGRSMGHTGPTAGPPRTLVTGGTGFLGMNRTDELLLSGRTVRIVGRREPSRPDHRPLFARADVLDPGRLTQVFAAFGPTEVVHLAATTGFLTREDQEGFRTNTEGTRNVVR